MNAWKKFLYNIKKRDYYITCEWTDKQGNRVQSWRTITSIYNLKLRHELLKFIAEMEKEMKDFYLTWFTEIK